MNNKGFMMAEVIVVSAVILVTLVSLYTSYNKIFSLYNNRVNYYDINTLYELSLIRDNSLYGAAVNNTSSLFTGYDFNDEVSGVERTLFYIDKMNISTVNTDGINSTFKDYIDYLSSSVDYNKKIIASDGTEYEWNEMLIYEKCTSSDECTYAYLEVPAI